MSRRALVLLFSTWLLSVNPAFPQDKTESGPGKEDSSTQQPAPLPVTPGMGTSAAVGETGGTRPDNTIRIEGGNPDKMTAQMQLELWASMFRAAAIDKEQGRYQPAEKGLLSCVSLAEKFGPDNRYLMQSLNLLAGTYRYLGKLKLSEETYEKVLRILEKQTGPDSVDTATVMDNLGIVFTEDHLFDRSEKMHKQALEIYKKKSGESSLDYGICLANLGGSYYKQGKYNEALESGKQALAIEEKNLGHNNLAIANQYDNLANIYSDIGKFDESDASRKQALAIYEKIIPKDHVDRGICLKNLAVTAVQRGQLQQAIDYFNECKPIMVKSLGANHPEVKDIDGKIDQIKTRMGK